MARELQEGDPCLNTKYHFLTSQVLSQGKFSKVPNVVLIYFGSGLCWPLSLQHANGEQIREFRKIFHVVKNDRETL